MSLRAHLVSVAISILSSFSSVIANSQKRMKQSLCMSLRGHAVTAAISFFFTLPCLAFAEEKIPVFPTTPIEAYTVYGSLALFWLAIIFLIIVIKMKLNEIERIKKLGIDKDDEEAPKSPKKSLDSHLRDCVAMSLRANVMSEAIS